MKHRLKLLLFVVGVPTILAGVAGASVWWTMARWSRAMERADRVEAYAADAMPAPVTLDDLCASANVLFPSCLARRSASGMLWVSLGAVIAGGALLGGLLLAGKRCRGQRERLIAIFEPAMWVTLTTAALLVLANATLLGLLMRLFGALAGVSWGAETVIGVPAATAGLIGLIYTARQVSRPVTQDVLGVVTSGEGTADLRELVRAVARRLHAPVPDNIVVGVLPTFFVTQTNVICTSGELAGRTLYLSLPLCRILTVAELVSIIGHELAHFSGGDTGFTLRVAPIYNAANDAMSALGRQTSLLRRLVLRPPLALCRFFFDCFHEAVSGIRRDRELRADQASIEATDANTAATALVKEHVFDRQWWVVVDQIHTALPVGYGEVNLSAMFAERVRTMPPPRSLVVSALDTRVPHPFDAHPPLTARMAGFGVSIEQVQEAALTIPARPAIALFSDIESTELTLSHILRARYDEFRRSQLRWASQS